MAESKEESRCLQTGGPSCLVCQAVADAIVNWPIGNDGHREHVSLGDWEGFLRRVDCETCQQLFRYFESRNRLNKLKAVSPSCPIVLEHVYDIIHIRCRHTLDPRRSHNHTTLPLVASQFFVPHGSHYMSLNSDRIDVSQLKQWLAHCEWSHSKSCHQPLKLQIASSVTFIDVQRSCLVTPTVMPVKYVALSYVWGNIPGSLMATSQNISYLFSPACLEAPETNSCIPRTILDAIALTKLMEVKYLWVDRLCIVQDDSRHFNSQLQQMASIYSSSYFTIIAADGQDANHGLRGLPAPALPRVYKQIFLEFPLNIKLLAIDPPEHISNMANWYNRAWTFQERAISRKTLVFVNGTAYWQCRTATWRENNALREGYFTRGATSMWPAHALTLHAWPDIEQYYELVNGYNSRTLSFESDALRGFSAIMNAFNSSFPNGFLSGVPEFLFDIGLLWSTSKPLNRRKGFPSWSWVGWSGRIKFAMGSAWSPNDASYFKLEVRPTVEWKKILNENQVQIRIDNSYHLYPQMINDSDTALPEGWRILGEHRSLNGYSKMFAHSSIQGWEFHYPFPVTDDVTALNLDLYSPILPFRTQKCRMFLGALVGDTIDLYSASGPCLTVEVRDNTGMRAGVIESLFVSQHEYEKGDPCELIAISKGSFQRDLAEYRPIKLFEEAEIFPELKDRELYEFYNVLWIEWEDGIAYRKALGRVMKGRWERQALEDADILLG